MMILSKLETFFTPSEEVNNFLLCLFIGLIIGIAFDILRAFRAIIPHNTFFTALEDIAFILLWGLELLIFSVEQGRGILRFYFLLGNIIGFSLYILVVGNFIITVIRKTSLKIRKFMKFICTPFLNFFAFIKQKVCNIFVRNALKLKKHNKKHGIDLKA